MSPDLIISVSENRGQELRDRAARERAATTWRRAHPGRGLRERVVARFAGPTGGEHAHRHPAPRARRA